MLYRSNTARVLWPVSCMATRSGTPARTRLRGEHEIGRQNRVTQDVSGASCYAVIRFLSELLYDTKALDITTFLATCAGLFVVAMLASCLPARRPASVSPLECLRSE